MSDVQSPDAAIAGLRAAAAAANRTAAVRDEAFSRAHAHKKQTQQDEDELAQLTEELQAHHMAMALGKSDIPTAPDVSTLENLRAKIAIAAPVSKELQNRVHNAEQAATKAEDARRVAISDFIRKTELEPALAELAPAWEQVREILVRIMAAHNLANVQFNDRARAPNCLNDLHGPAAHFVSAMRSIQWESWPYDVAPAWLSMQGTVGYHGLGGVTEREREIRDQIEQELAA